MLSLDEQVDIFDIFHVGTITALIKENGNIRFEIEIPYLAELLNPQFSSFKLQIVGCREFWYQEWGEDIRPITDLSSINMLNLGILDAESKANGSIVIRCWNKELGGELTIKTEDILIFDQADRLLNLPTLFEICHRYWDGLNN